MENKPMTVDKEAIEPILVKHIIEAQRKNLREDISDATRRTNAKWYLINSTDSYIGLINGIKEFVDEYAASLLKENEELKEENQTFRNAFNRADDLINSQINALYASNEAKDREIAELKERFEKSFSLAEIRRKEIDKLII